MKITENSALVTEHHIMFLDNHISLYFIHPNRYIETLRRPVALTVRAPDSKSGSWGFESLLACHFAAGYPFMVSI
jgi:hypothetical protein